MLKQPCLQALAALWLLFIAATAQAQPSAGPGSTRQGLLDKLSRSARVLNHPDVIQAMRDASGKPQVLIFLGNENLDTPEARRKADVVTGWLQASPAADVQFLGRSIAFDQRAFPQVIAAESATLSAGMSRLPAARQAPLVLLTNAQASRGFFNYQLPGSTGPEAAPFGTKLSAEQASRRYPLMDPDVLRFALEAIAAKFDPARFDFVLIVKSHGSSGHLFVPRLVADPEHVSQADIVEPTERALAEKLKMLVQDGTPVFNEQRRPIVDTKGRRLLIRPGGSLIWEQVGRVALLPGQPLALGNRAGEAFRAAGGERVLIRDGKLVLEATHRPVLSRDGRPLQLLGVAGFGQRLVLVDSAKDSLPRVRIELGGTETMSLPLDEPVVMPIPATGAVEETAKPDAGPAAAVLAEDTKWFTNAHLGGSEKYYLDGVLGAQEKYYLDGVLGGSEKYYLDGVLDGSAPVVQAGRSLRLGMTHEEFWQILKSSGQGRMYFPLVFLESCHSELGQVEVDWARGSDVPVGVVWTSDRTGLEYRTVDYRVLFDTLQGAGDVDRAVGQMLEAAWRRHHPTTR